VTTQIAEAAARPDAGFADSEAPVLEAAPVAAAAPEQSRPVRIAPVHDAASPPVLARARSIGHRALAELAYGVRRLGATTVAGIGAVVAAVTLFVASNLPQGAAVTALKGQLVQLAPQGKVPAVAAPAGAALAALPPRADAPNVVAKILEEARAAGVELPRGQYEYVPARDGMAARYRMTFPVHASYPQIRAFMDRTLLALPAVAVDGLRIERKTVGDGGVDAELKLSAFVRSEP
jgi:hypothetical protein